jgi:hypothetical protein
MLLPNKNRRKKAKQMKRDERRGHILVSLLSTYMSPLGSILISLPLLVLLSLKMILVQWYAKEVVEFLVCKKGKANEGLGANTIFTSTIS